MVSFLIIFALDSGVTFTDISSWTRHDVPVTCDLHAACFVDTEGWVLAHQAGIVLHASDVGGSWSIQAELGEGYLEDIFFLNGKCGWICGERGRILVTTDQGVAWQDVGLADPQISLSAIHFFDKSEGMVVGTDLRGPQPVVYHSMDGGHHWARLVDDIPGFFLSDAMCLTSETEGFVGGLKTIAHFTEKGKTWSVFDTQERVMIRGLFFEAQKGWAVGHGGVWLTTENAGVTWEFQSEFTKNRLRNVAFITKKVGYICGDRGPDPTVLWVTRDGGSTWEAALDEVPDLHRLVSTPTRLWATGKQGTLLSLELASP